MTVHLLGGAAVGAASAATAALTADPILVAVITAAGVVTAALAPRLLDMRRDRQNRGDDPVLPILLDELAAKQHEIDRQQQEIDRLRKQLEARRGAR